MDFIVSTLYVLHLLLLFTALGLPIARLVPKELGQRMLLAPPLGFAFYGTIATTLYKQGVPVEVVFAASSAVAVLILAFAAIKVYKIKHIITRPAIRETFKHFSFICLLLSVTIILQTLPILLGGQQFAAFQGNHWDHFDYLAAATSFRSYSYAALDSASPELLASNNFVFWGREVLNIRPTISLVYASSYKYYFESAVYGSYAYLCSIQILCLPPFLWICNSLLPKHRLLSEVAALAFTCGFFVQYIFDINAWSQLSSLPIAITALGLTLAYLHLCLATRQEDAGVANSIRMGGDEPRFAAALPVGIAWGGLIFFYPESLTVYGLAGLGSILIALLIAVRGRKANWNAFYVLAIGGLIALGSTAGYWRGSMAWLISQLRTTSGAPVDWYKYFQRYLLGSDVKYFDWPAGEWSSSWMMSTYAPISFATDIFYGSLGLYKLLPTENVTLVVRLFWKAGLLGLAILFLTLCVRAVIRIFSDKVYYWQLAVGCCLFSLILPVALVLTNRYWAAGKALSMASPLLFILLLLPFANISGPRSRIAMALSILFLTSQIGWGIARPLSAASSRQADGIHYSSPYPAIQYPYLKATFNWDLRKHERAVRKCSNVEVDIEDLFLDRYVQVWIADMGVSWASKQPLRMMSSPQPIGVHKALPSADCLLTAQKQPPKQGQKLLSLRRGKK